MPRLSAVPDPAAGHARLGPPAFLCTRHTGGTLAAWIKVAGEVDLSTSVELERTLREALLDARLLVLDARGVTFIDSSGIHAIVDASLVAQSAGAQLILVPSPVVDRVLGLSGARDRLRTLELDTHDSAFELRVVPEAPAA